MRVHRHPCPTGIVYDKQHCYLTPPLSGERPCGTRCIPREDSATVQPIPAKRLVETMRQGLACRPIGYLSWSFQPDRCPSLAQIRTLTLRFGALLLACALIWVGQACTRLPQPMRVACGGCEDQARFVRLQVPPDAQRDGRRYTHPFHLNAEDWKPILSSIRVKKRNAGFLIFHRPEETVIEAFPPEEIQFLSAALSKAFAQARPEEWVVFLVSRPTSPDVMEVTTGAWYVEESNLHFVLTNYRDVVALPSTRELLWEEPLWTDADLFYDLVPGKHQSLVKEEIALKRLLVSSPSDLSIAYQPLLLAESAPSEAAERSGGGSGQQTSQPPPSTPPPLSLEDRLQTLKRLRDQGLITEEQYKAKTKQLLDQF